MELILVVIYNGTDPGTGDDHNGTQGNYRFLNKITMNQAETLIDGYAPAGSYAVEIFMQLSNWN